MSKIKLSYFNIILILLFLTFIIISCGDKKKESSGEIKTEDQTAQVQAKEDQTKSVFEKDEKGLLKVSLVLKWVPQCQFIGYYVAKDKGFYEKEGLNVDIMAGGINIYSTELVENKEKHFGIAWLSQLVPDKGKGKFPNVRDIAQIYQRTAEYLVSHKKLGVTKPADLAGKRIGIWPQHEAKINALIEKTGLNPDKIEIVPEDFTNSSWYTDKADVTSAMIYNEYHAIIDKLESEGKSKDDINVLDYTEYGINIPEDCIIAHIDTIKNHKDVCIKFVKASIEGWKYSFANKEEALDIIMKYAEGTTRKHQLDMLNEVEKIVLWGPGKQKGIGYFDPAVIDNALDIYKLKGKLKHEEIYDASIWEEVFKVIQ